MPREATKTARAKVDRNAIHPGHIRYRQMEFSLLPSDPWSRRQFAHVFEPVKEPLAPSVPVDPDPWRPKGAPARAIALEDAVLMHVGL